MHNANDAKRNSSKDSAIGDIENATASREEAYTTEMDWMDAIICPEESERGHTHIRDRASLLKSCDIQIKFTKYLYNNI
jgi:hypothetical protein